MGKRAQRGYDESACETFASLPWRTRFIARLLSVTVVAAVAALALLLSLGHLLAETVDVKYRGPVNLASFQCTNVADSGVVERVCYNSENAYMLINLKGTWYHYCRIDGGTVAALLSAPSKGSFYNSSVKDSGTGGQFSCRHKPVPQF